MRRQILMVSKSEQAALRQALANLSVSSTPTQASLPKSALPVDADGSFSVLPIDQIDVYKYNPRVSRNPRYDEIKASIKAEGITNMLTVTRPDQHSKYTTYGGGNTRLAIAKELYAEGDQRFATLKVVVKAWPGDAQIILAQLSENEHRADISFWEKANSVERFRIEFERETGKALSARDLHTELKKRGISYSLKTLQNFAFCIENLHPIGQWLRSSDVSEVIRPSYLMLLRLSQKLHKEAKAPEAFESVLRKHATRLSEASPAQELDTGALIADWRDAFAELIEVSIEHLQIMLDALKDNSNINAQELRAACVQPVFQEAVAEEEEEEEESDSDSELEDDGEYEPLVSSTTSKDESYTTKRPKTTPTQQTTLPPTERSAQKSRTAADDRNHDIKLVDKLRSEIRETLKQISEVVPLQDVICVTNEMPFGFYIDFPENTEAVDDKSATSQRLRVAMWKFLLSISGQLDRRLTKHLPNDDSGMTYKFSRELAQDEDTFRAAFEKHGVTLDEKNRPHMQLGEISMIFADPQLPHYIIQLLNTIEQVRMTTANYAPDGFQALFSTQT
ncbi:MAG: ParB N-terminal domain-containing protein [Actinomycetaceae bacterium]|nr:ParB N-terminal domain-containing protein [Actinomycetaceae bacterium]